MKRIASTVLVGFPLVLCALVSSNGASSRREIRFEERVAAQELIDRIYREAQAMSGSPVVAAPSRVDLERRVLRQMDDEEFLRERSGASISRRELKAELRRIQAQTHDPERLRAVSAALSDDLELILEAYVRPNLVARRVLDLTAGSGLAAASTTQTKQGGWRPLPSTTSLWWYNASVWTGAYFIVYGGWNSFGLRYDPAVDAWSAISEVGKPPRAQGSSAVWTGSEVIVWGGFNGDPVVPGGRYDPLSDTWTPVSTDGQPRFGYGHVALWTGREMLIWGGFYDDGARYDPRTDTWTPMSRTNAPQVRWGASGVWTGSRMLVWGGLIGDNSDAPRFDDGGAYDPATDTWTRILPGPFSPSARGQHTAVWTGSRMIIWGGQTESLDSLDDGASYDPVTGSWEPLATGNAPSSRFDHGAVWTGQEMIIWGGRTSQAKGGNNPEYFLNDGRAYNPLRDEWRGLVGTNSLTARFQFSTAWTGREMLIWGGQPSTATQTSGVAYTPRTK